MPFAVADFSLPKVTDDSSKTSDSGTALPAVGDESTDSGSEIVVKDDTSTTSDSGSADVDNTKTDTNSGTTTVDDTSTVSTDSTIVNSDKTSSSSDGSSVISDKSTNSSTSDIILDDVEIDSSVKTLIDDVSYIAPNERIVTADEIITKTENIVGDISSGVVKEVVLESSYDIKSVKLMTSSNLEDVKVTVIKLKDKPEEIIEPPKKNATIYKYLDIKLSANDTFIDEEELDTVEFNFKVEITWIAENYIDKSTIKLIRYHDGVWQNLSTTLSGENDTCITYIALSPGFSTFAVVGSKVIEKGESYGSDDVGIPWSIIIAFVMTLSIMLVFILFKARYIYLKEEK
jgi:PGF-pre-PGF domain-containing protein